MRIATVLPHCCCNTCCCQLRCEAYANCMPYPCLPLQDNRRYYIKDDAPTQLLIDHDHLLSFVPFSRSKILDMKFILSSLLHVALLSLSLLAVANPLHQQERDLTKSEDGKSGLDKRSDLVSPDQTPHPVAQPRDVSVNTDNDLSMTSNTIKTEAETE